MEFTVQDLRAMLNEMAELMSRERDRLCALDAATGDGDHGIAMANGMTAASKAADETDADALGEILTAAALGFLNAVGASSGPLYATAFMNAAKEVGDASSIPRNDLRRLIVAMAAGIAQRGKAVGGQRTMLDAWEPAATVASGDAAPADISGAAADGAEATSDMVASIGRSAKLGDRVLGHPDPGATSAAMLIEIMCRYMDEGSAR